MKFVRFLLCAALLLSSASGVFAAEDSGVTEALQQVKERIDTSRYDNFRSSYYKDDDGGTSYNFYWTGNNENSELYVEIKSGIIDSYGKYEYGREDSVNAFALSETDAIGIAKEFLRKINPDIYESIEIVPTNDMSIRSETYSLNLYRKEAGIPVLDETGYISVSKKDREVTSFYINYTAGVEFKPLDSVISIDEAKEAYKELIPPTLRYKFKRDYNKKEITAYLEYAPKDSALAINAYDGSVYERAYGVGFYYSRSAAMSEDSAEGGGFTPAELEETEKIAGLLSEEDATATAKKNEIIAIPKDFEREYISLNRNWFNKNEYIYELGFANDEYYISASLDAKSGEILSFYNYSKEEQKGKQNRKAEEQKAQQALKTLAGAKASEMRLIESEEPGRVVFVRAVNGLDVSGDGAYIGFDESDNIVDYTLRYTKDVDFPSKSGVITPEKAAETAFDEVGFYLAYSIDGDGKTAQPIYCIGKDGETEGFMINPFSAHLVDYQGDDIESAEKIVYSDIENHYAKQIFLALAEYGIGLGGGELKPDEAITQAEYFSLLNKAFGYEADTDEIYKRMISEGTISAEERADSSVLTRENAAIFMIREMGAERYARHNDIFEAPFNDVTENKGYIAILKAEKILNGDGSGNFYPKKSVTRGEALIMIYNYFTK